MCWWATAEDWRDADATTTTTGLMLYASVDEDHVRAPPVSPPFYPLPEYIERHQQD